MVANVEISFFKWLNNTPLCAGMCVCGVHTHICIQSPIMNTSSVSMVSATLNDASMNTGAQVSFQVNVFVSVFFKFN